MGACVFCVCVFCLCVCMCVCVCVCVCVFAESGQGYAGIIYSRVKLNNALLYKKVAVQ